MKNMRTSIVSAAIASAIVLATGRVSAQSNGIKDTERFIKSGDLVSQAVAAARLGAKTALDAHNLVVLGTSANMKGDFKKLTNAEAAMSKKIADARKVVGEMDKQSAAYFTGRMAALGQIEDSKLRELAKSRLEASQREYESIKVQLRSASESLAPFSQSLIDQIRYLGTELTPGAAQSLTAQSEALNSRGSEVFAQADAAVGAANQYFGALRPTRTRPAEAAETSAQQQQ